VVEGSFGFCLFSIENFGGEERGHEGGIGICGEHLFVAATRNGSRVFTAARLHLHLLLYL
jgi:hypothetical protein